MDLETADHKLEIDRLTEVIDGMVPKSDHETLQDELK